MVHKKKFLNIFLYIFFLMFFGSTLSNSCNAVTLDDYQLTDDIMEDIVQEVGLGDFYSGDYIPLLTNCFNTMMRTVRARGDGHLVTLADCVFAGAYSSNVSLQYLQVSFINWRDNDMDQRAFLENNYQPYINLYGQHQEGGTLNGTINVYDWKGWTYDSNNNITGYIAGAFPRWQLTQTTFTYNSSNYLQVYQPTFTRISSGDISINKILVLDNSKFDGIDGSVLFATRTYQWGYGFDIYSHVLYLEDYGTTPTPTPTPTAIPTGGGGGSTDLTQTNNLISGVINTLNDTPSGDDFDLPSSGDLLDASGIPTIVDPTSNFWLTITNGLFSALTSDQRYYELDILGTTYVFDNQAFVISNDIFRNFINITQTVCFVFVEYKIIRKLVNMYSSGVFSQIMRAYSRIDISDLF